MKTKFVKFAGTLGALALSLTLAGPALANSMTYTPGTVILDNNLNCKLVVAFINHQDPIFADIDFSSIIKSHFL